MPSFRKVVSDMEYNTLPSPAKRRLEERARKKAKLLNGAATAAATANANAAPNHTDQMTQAQVVVGSVESAGDGKDNGGAAVGGGKGNVGAAAAGDGKDNGGTAAAGGNKQQTAENGDNTNSTAKASDVTISELQSNKPGNNAEIVVLDDDSDDNDEVGSEGESSKSWGENNELKGLLDSILSSFEQAAISSHAGDERAMIDAIDDMNKSRPTSPTGLKGVLPGKYTDALCRGLMALSEKWEEEVRAWPLHKASVFLLVASNISQRSRFLFLHPFRTAAI